MAEAEMVESVGSNVNWLLIAIIAGSAILGVIVGILLGKHSMKKKDI